jgi:hypothetical protein
MSFETAAYWGMGAVLVFGLVALLLGLFSKPKPTQDNVKGRHAH